MCIAAVRAPVWENEERVPTCVDTRSFVGVAGFEPTTSSSRTKRAAKLRYTPKQQAQV